MKRASLATVALLAALAAARPHSTTPNATITREGALTMNLPEGILQSAEVKKHLTSGLTTAFVIGVKAGEREGGARVSVRYELWDETYLVSSIDVTGHEQKLVFPSHEKLVEWWSAASLTVIQAGVKDGRVVVTMKVLPFSAREQAETQRWLARTLATMKSVRDAPVDKHSDAGAAKILDVIVGTSIQSRPILEHRWTIDARRVP